MALYSESLELPQDLNNLYFDPDSTFFLFGVSETEEMEDNESEELLLFNNEVKNPYLGFLSDWRIKVVASELEVDFVVTVIVVLGVTAVGPNE
ncbi:1270_t:CDS:1, partial [Acaulospora colombiana]